MEGRATAERERTIVLAHQIEAMAREERLRPVDHYLNRAKRTDTGQGGGLLAMLQRFKDRQDRRQANGEG
ncbi:hypothetical protein GS397_15015 [Sphingobium yanoikuyae]|uniref:Uncharacterized protein n=1 Tax=Sphingobium yanoikuyae TaxID=13690 RepID=A0A6P1GI67_SPHYA|nr:hypothetical protein [Sphingobium yanoikuyae]QHD68225.1 hypothetical protein GS397_15015 [Sphingobium yanoikuyae]